MVGDRGVSHGFWFLAKPDKPKTMADTRLLWTRGFWLWLTRGFRHAASLWLTRGFPEWVYGFLIGLGVEIAIRSRRAHKRYIFGTRS
jgi:hypothetical protein